MEIKGRLSSHPRPAGPSLPFLGAFLAPRLFLVVSLGHLHCLPFFWVLFFFPVVLVVRVGGFLVLRVTLRWLFGLGARS